MKKKILLFAVCFASAIILAACNVKAEDVSTDVVELSSEDISSDSDSSDADIPGSDEAFKYEKVIYAPSEYVKLGDYGKIVINLDVPETLTEEDITDFINNTLVSYPDYEISNKSVVEEGDTVDVSFTANLPGSTEKEADEEGYILKVGSGVLIPGFEESLTGRKTGDNYTIKLTYPENGGNEEYLGKELEFHISVNSILDEKIYTYENVDTAYLKDKMGVYSKDSLYSDTSSEMYRMLADILSGKKEDVVNIYLSTCEYSFPDGLLENRFEQEKEIFINNYFDGDIEKYNNNIEETASVSRQDFEKQLMESVKTDTAFEMVSHLIAEKENIIITDDEFDSYVKTAASTVSSEMDAAEFLSTYDTGYETGEEYFQNLLLKDKVEGFLSDRVVFEYDNTAKLSDYIFNTGK
ncbi:MAG: FKBP-type peptidyl-prolyl cis-trans isomerase [Butyrivibrio sp.]|nr:FKBP-type peptidyl-prolyl cis-trans isomerase [Butyrivibrio sp.]